MYDHIRKKLARGETIILDGGTGTDIQRRGGAMSGETWCADANLTHPDVVREVHEDYIRAGAELITANTFATSALLFNDLGPARRRRPSLAAGPQHPSDLWALACLPRRPALSHGLRHSPAESRRSPLRKLRGTALPHCLPGLGLRRQDL